MLSYNIVEEIIKNKKILDFVDKKFSNKKIDLIRFLIYIKNIYKLNYDFFVNNDSELILLVLFNKNDDVLKIDKVINEIYELRDKFGLDFLTIVEKFNE